MTQPADVKVEQALKNDLSLKDMVGYSNLDTWRTVYGIYRKNEIRERFI